MSERLRYYAIVLIAVVVFALIMTWATACHFHLVTIEVPKGSAAAKLLSLQLEADPVRVEVVNSNGTPVNDNQTPDEILDEIINQHGGQP